MVVVFVPPFEEAGVVRGVRFPPAVGGFRGSLLLSSSWPGCLLLFFPLHLASRCQGLLLLVGIGSFAEAGVFGGVCFPPAFGLFRGSLLLGSSWLLLVFVIIASYFITIIIIEQPWLRG